MWCNLAPTAPNFKIRAATHALDQSFPFDAENVPKFARNEAKMPRPNLINHPREMPLRRVLLRRTTAPVLLACSAPAHLHRRR